MNTTTIIPLLRDSACSAGKSPVFIIRTKAGHALHLVKNLCGRHYSIATWHLNPAQHTVCEFNLQPA
jgi:hypothetical protein